jgi:hypothetical protein
MKKTFNFGKVAHETNKKTNLVTIEMELKYNSRNLPVFSAMGNVWNSKKTDILCGGQCIDSIYDEFSEQLENVSLYKEIMELWQNNHLNDINAGTQEQENAIKEWIKQGNTYDYNKVCEYLKSIDLYEVKQGELMYKYGSAWIYRDIPEKDLKRIKEIIEIES